MFDFQNILTISLTLFAVIDILGTLPVILSLQEKTGPVHSEKVTLISGGIMLTFFFVGEELLQLIGVDISSFAIAGAIVIFILAMEMVLEREFFRHSTGGNMTSVVPIAFPMIAGAGTLTTLISLRAAYEVPDILAAVVINLLVIYGVLKSKDFFAKLLGKGGIAVLRRVFGIVLLAIAIKLFKSNIGA